MFAVDHPRNLRMTCCFVRLVPSSTYAFAGPRAPLGLRNMLVAGHSDSCDTFALPKGVDVRASLETIREFARNALQISHATSAGSLSALGLFTPFV
jgi:hypothetical protein